MLTILVAMPFLAAPALSLAGKKSERLRDNLVWLLCLIELFFSLLLPAGSFHGGIPGVFGMGLHFSQTGFRTVYSIITSLMWAFTSLFSKEYFAHERKGLNAYFVFWLLTLGATQGVMLSADLLTTFVFFEILSFTSFTWVIHEQTPGAVRAGMTYLFIAVIGGLVLFLGMALLWHRTGTLSYEALSSLPGAVSGHGEVLASSLCILFGFGCKAGMFPVHIWLPKAHPVAPSPASALLSGVLTKVGIYGILMTALTVMAENRLYGLIVLSLGTVTMVLGALLALFSVNLKRTLACSSMSQVGFILVGTGMSVLLGGENGVPLSGTVLHMVNHSLIKLTLFMAAGVVVMNLDNLNLDDIRGWGRNKPLLMISFALGALGISGVPGFNGYISKTLLHEGIVEGMHHLPELFLYLKCTEWIFLVSGGCTFAYMLKLFICLFLEKNPIRQAEFDQSRRAMNPASSAVILISSLFMLFLGQPRIMKTLASYMTGSEALAQFEAFSFENLKGSLISLGIGALIYLAVVRGFLMKRVSIQLYQVGLTTESAKESLSTKRCSVTSYLDRWPAWLDLEEGLYRPLLTAWLPKLFGTAASVFGENQVLTVLCRHGLRFAMILARAFSDSLDALIVLARKTFIREVPVRSAGRMKNHFGMRLADESEEAFRPYERSFSFALMMTCIGILVIFAVLFYLVG